MKQKLIVIAGTNASGKSNLGVQLAARYGGEVISADSRQVFRGLDLGSGKITQEEMQGVPHHLIDICNPGDFFSMADFQRLAYQAIDDIHARGKSPSWWGARDYMWIPWQTAMSFPIKPRIWNTGPILKPLKPRRCMKC